MYFFRIKQISKNEFIPQTRKRLGFISFTAWQGIESRNNLLLRWYGDYFQEKQCKVSSYEEALKVIEDNKKIIAEIIAENSGYPKYHKVK
jgi:hypothetical protein